MDFDVTFATPYRLLERFSKLACSDDVTFNYSLFLLDLTIFNTKMLLYKPSQVAGAVIYLAKKIINP